jgi:glyoxylase-like metal-dependent hydrolase (beta-lactamase superfamily II)
MMPDNSKPPKDSPDEGVMIVDTFPVGLLQCNCTILARVGSSRAIVIDPGDDADVILGRLERLGLDLERIVSTHAHLDHVGAIHGLQTKTGAAASIHEDDLFLFDHLDDQAAWLGLPAPRRGEIDRFIDDGDTVAVPDFGIGVIHTPGHTPGSLTFHLNSANPVLFTGDTLFFGSIGRTDLPGGDPEAILTSIRSRLLGFDPETIVIPGHGPRTTIGRERAENPFLGRFR